MSARTRARGVTIGVTLTREQVAAYLAAGPPSRGHGVRLSIALTEADQRLRAAMRAALRDALDATTPAPDKEPTP